MFSSPIRLKPLAQLCHRLATATHAGLDDRRIWQDEAKRARGAQREQVRQISEQLNRGVSISDAFARTGDYFPSLFRQLATVGDTSGRHAQTYQRLADHYDRQLAARQAFLGQLSWPLLQLGIALGVIGLLIWIMGILPGGRGPGSGPTDMLGWGLTGTRGLTIYLAILAAICLGLLLIWEASRRGVLWTRRMQTASLRIPGLGSALKTLALSRFAWALHLVLDTPMDLRRALPLALETTGYDHYRQHARSIARDIQQGQDLYSALAATGAFPADLLDAVAVGEASGQLVESMGRISREYNQRATLAISVLAQIAGYAVWLLVAAFIILMIFRLASFYINTIQQFAQPMN
jgi:type IV pilus assembly protein PilC